MKKSDLLAGRNTVNYTPQAVKVNAHTTSSECYTIPMSKTVPRLFEQFQPGNYNLQLRVDPDAMTFEGTVVIAGKKTGRPSQRITLHQKALDVYEAYVRRTDKKGEKIHEVTRINNQDSYDEVRLHCGEMLYPGEYTIMLHFRGKITDGMTGMYPCYFKDGDVEKKLIATQFESHHAREVFPCIDEPEAKATFDLIVTTPTGQKVLSNTPVKEQFTNEAENPKPGEEKLRTIFETTPRMSTYLLAFVFGDIHSKSTKTARGTEVNVWATTAQPAESLDFALDVSKRSIEFFEDYFGVDYPLPKADHIALPDFSSGAMENWGLITYRERVLLAYPGETAQSTFEHIALVIAHETSHQWFGNLVTMKWWDDLWLNESFANMMEYQAVEAMFPQWHVWNQFIAAEGLSAIRRDAVAGVQAVKTDVNHPDEISSLFDPSIVYAKGGRLLYMLKNYIGEEAFRSGLAAYFKLHAYGNTTGADLWAALSEASGKDVASFMNPWLTRSGFPVVTVSQNNTQIKLTQEHFLDDPAKANKELVWPVPLFSNSLSEDTLLVPANSFVTNSDSLVRVNEGARGHYIVRYESASQRQQLIDSVKAGEINEPDRLMLLNDASMLSKAGYLPFGEVLQMLDAYSEETSESVWDIMSLVVAESRRFIDHDETQEPKIKIFIDNLVAKEVTRLGWDTKPDEPSEDTKLRGLMLGLGAYADNVAITKKATELFDGYRHKDAQLPAELRSLIFSIPIKSGNADAFDYLLKIHDSTQNSELMGDACDGLTSTRNPEQAKKLLARLKDAKLVKPQDLDRWLIFLMRNRHTRNVAWQWMVDNWQFLQDTFENDKSYDYLPRYAASCVTTREYEQKFHELFDSKIDQPLLKRNIQLGIEDIQTRINWLERDLSSVRDFFSR